MNKINVILAILLSIAVSLSVEAQTKKKTPKKGKARTQITNEKPAQKTDNKPQQKTIPAYKQFSNPELVKYITGGFTKDHKLFIITSPDYCTLNNDKKKALLSEIALDFPEHDIVIYKDNQQRELWISNDQNLYLLDLWDNDSLKIEKYMPLALNKSGKTKVFFQIGGNFSGSRGNHLGLFDFRCGSYLYKDRLDASASLSLGYTKSDKTQFSGSIGVDSRGYFPIKSINLSPYAGAGISWSFAPTSFFELKLLTGVCWFIGSGSIDAGLEFGIKSGFSFTIGYTFRPIFKR